MFSLAKIVKLVGLIGAFGLAGAISQAVIPPPDGGYANQNTAEGEDALFSLSTGADNAALGYNALYATTTGFQNTAVGSFALANNVTGYNNTAIGNVALAGNTTGYNNTADGLGALRNTTTGGNNTAAGLSALTSNITGGNNMAIGASALFYNGTGNNNTAAGTNSLQYTRGNDNIGLGYQAGFNVTTGSNNIEIGHLGANNDSNRIRIGKQGVQTATSIAGITGTTVAGGVGVLIDSTGRLGTLVSSARYKEFIKPMDKSSEAIFSLKPVAFHYKHELDPDGIPQFGLVAEQVEKVNPDLVARDESGKPYTVRYEAVNAMLLNEFLKEHRKVQTLEASLAQVEKDSSARAAKQQSEIDSLTAALKAQAAQIQKVSDQVGAQAAAPRVVVND